MTILFEKIRNDNFLLLHSLLLWNKISISFHHVVASLLTCSHTLAILNLSLSLSLSLSHTHSLTLSLSLSLSLSLAYTLSHSFSRTHSSTHTHTLILSFLSVFLSLYLFLTHTHTHTHTHAHAHTQALTHAHTHSRTHTHTHSSLLTKLQKLIGTFQSLRLHNLREKLTLMHQTVYFAIHLTSITHRQCFSTLTMRTSECCINSQLRVKIQGHIKFST